MKVLQEEKRVLEEQLETLSHATDEERQKVALLASEKKARGQVSS